ncbi:MAG: YdjY domain-containing protein [Planctomycetota bacterium]
MPSALRLDVESRTIEFDGTVAVDTTNPDTPDVYLELVACSPDTREHESLVVSPVAPSSIHAALLTVGATPGAPGRVSVTADGIARTPATGTPLAVEFIWSDDSGHRHVSAPSEWIRSESGVAVTEFQWVFAGSRFVVRGGREVYDADGTGTLIGLTTFGSEVIAPRVTLSPNAATDAPAFLARNEAMPRAGTPVTVRVRAN